MADVINMALQRISDTPMMPELVEKALAQGDISKMPADQQAAYYRAVCLSAGLNWLTRPFEALEGRDGSYRLYARKEAAEQLRKIHNVSIKTLSRETVDNLYIVTVKASMPDGREEEGQGIVALTKAKREQQGKWPNGDPKFVPVLDEHGEEIHIPLRGEALANAMMKCETKAKRRITLSICGLGFSESGETEYIEIPPADIVDMTKKPVTFEGASAASELIFGQAMTRPVNDIEGPTAPPTPPTSTAWRPPQREMEAPVLGEEPITGASINQQKLITRLGQELNWSDPKIDEYIASLPSIPKASDAIRELQVAVTARREEKQQGSPRFGTADSFYSRLAMMGRWKPWPDVVKDFIKNKGWDWDNLTPTQRTAIAHTVVGVEPPLASSLFDDRWTGILEWAEKTGGLEPPYDLGIWAVDKYASGNTKDSLEYKPKDMPDDAIDAIKLRIQQVKSSVADEIRAYAEKMRQL